MIEGFDSRDATVWPPQAAARFFLGKATEISNGPGYYGFGHHKLLIQFDLAISRGMDFGAWHFFRSVSSFSASHAARYYYHFLRPLGLIHFPPIVDAEDRVASQSATTAIRLWDTVQAVEQRFGEMALIYSARWWWNVWVLPWLPRGHPIYLRPLWEADPPPDTLEPGHFAKPVGVQYKLDIHVPGFNADIDLDRFDPTWYAANVRERRIA